MGFISDLGIWREYDCVRKNNLGCVLGMAMVFFVKMIIYVIGILLNYFFIVMF